MGSNTKVAVVRAHAPYEPITPRTSPTNQDEEGNNFHNNIAHVALLGRCEFISIPVIDAVDRCNQPPDTPHRLFLGQIRFETTPAQMRWLLWKVACIEAVKVEPTVRSQGCFIVHLKSAEDVNRVRALHKRLLFDHLGAWFARDTNECDLMQQYLESIAPYQGRWYRLPKDSMVVEQQKNVHYRNVSPPPPPPFGAPTYQHVA